MQTKTISTACAAVLALISIAAAAAVDTPTSNTAFMKRTDDNSVDPAHIVWKHPTDLLPRGEETVNYGIDKGTATGEQGRVPSNPEIKSAERPM